MADKLSQIAAIIGLGSPSRKTAPVSPPIELGEDIVIDSRLKVNKKTWKLRQVAPAPDYVDITLAPFWLQCAHQQRQKEQEVIEAHQILAGALATVRPWDPNKDS